MVPLYSDQDDYVDSIVEYYETPWVRNVPCIHLIFVDVQDNLLLLHI